MKQTYKLLMHIVLFAVLVACMHLIALKLYLYWITDWFDIIMHGLGGFLIGLLALYGLIRVKCLDIATQRIQDGASIILLAVLVVGIFWEVWELYVGFTVFPADMLDTIIDICMDMVGGVVSLVYGGYLIWKNKA